VFAIGGVFATWSRYEAFYGTFAVIVLAAFLALYVPASSEVLIGCSARET
jgi:hypothetical protein